MYRVTGSNRKTESYEKGESESMNVCSANYHVFLEGDKTPPMYGIESGDGIRACRISTDFLEVSRLAEWYGRAGLSSVHLCDAVEDYCRGQS